MHCVFFQAEDGIRDLVRSRGLGDVYKRQVQAREGGASRRASRRERDRAVGDRLIERPRGGRAVSYTHLTLPTSDLV